MRVSMTEELGLQQVFRNGGTVDGDEWRIVARTGLVQRAGQQFLACAALALNEHAHIALGDAPGLVQ